MAPEPRASRAASSTVPWWGKTEAGEAEVLKAIDRLEDELSEERGLLRERLILEAERHANDASAAAASTSSTATAATSNPSPTPVVRDVHYHDEPAGAQSSAVVQSGPREKDKQRGVREQVHHPWQWKVVTL